MVVHGTLVVPRIAPLGSAFVGIKAGGTAPDVRGGPLPECPGRIDGIQDEKNMPGLRAPRQVDGNVVTGKTKKRHRVENKRRRLDRQEKQAPQSHWAWQKGKVSAALV